MSKYGYPEAGDHHAQQQKLAARMRASEALEAYDRLHGMEQWRAVARAQQDEGMTSSLISCSYDPMMLSATPTASQGRFALAGMYVDRTVAVNYVAVAAVAGANLATGGAFNGVGVYKYDYNAGNPQLILLGRSQTAMANWTVNIANGVWIGTLTKTNSNPSAYGLLGFDSSGSGLSNDWILEPGLYYAGAGYSTDGTGTAAQYIQGATPSTALQNMEFDAQAYPLGRFVAFTIASGVCPDVLGGSSGNTLTKVSNVPWMAMLS